MAREGDSRQRQLETAAVLGLFCVVVTLFKHWKTGIPPTRDVGLYLAAFFLFAGVFVRPLARLITDAWFGLSHLLGAVVSRAVLGVVFFGLLTPLAWVRRLFEKDPLRLKAPPPDAATFFVEVGRTYGPADLRRPW